MSSELELLKQRVTTLEAENTKLKQIIEEIANLRIENTKVKQIIKQNRTVNDTSQSSVSLTLSVTPQKPIPLSINDHSSKDDITNSVNLEQAQRDTTEKFVSSKINSNNTPKQIENTSDSKSDSDLYQPEIKSLEDKEIDDFVDSKVKERVGNEIRDRNREKKLQHESAGKQAQDLSQFHEITFRDMESQSQVNHNAKTVPSGNDQSHVVLTESPSLQTEVSELEQDDEIDKKPNR
ncbi:8679_t:CDS:1 [Paraglomus occultum]|uniref:8679_t:CDS:1 n=1 Tax=Paraglomus occultum TaxID=144539 RepID=A0A9N9D2L4_9GLOM|nr:8679_t:CDS:1 [Paraglomus occultum]